MAANVDSPKRRSLRLQDARVDVGSGAATIDSGARSPAKARTSGNAKRLSAERRVDTEGQERSSSKRRSTEAPHKKNGAEQGIYDTAPSTGRKEKRDSTPKSGNSMGPNTVKGAQPMEPNNKTLDSAQSPGGEHRNLRPRRSRDNSCMHVEDSFRAATDTNTSFSRETRSSKAKNLVAPGASIAIRGLVEGVISNKEKNDTTHLPEPNFVKTQGSEGPGESSSHDRSLRTRRSRDSSTTNKGAAGINTSLKRQTRSSVGQVHEEAESSMVTRGNGAKSNKEKTNHAEPISPQKGISEDSSRSNHPDRSPKGSSFNVEGSSRAFPIAETLKRKTRASGANLEEAAVTKQCESVVLIKPEKKNPKHAETRSQQGEGSEDSGVSSSQNISVEPRRNVISNVEHSPRRTGLSKGADASFARETRSSKAKNCEESGAFTAGQGLGEAAASSQENKKNACPTKPNHPEEERSDGLGGSDSHKRGLQQLKGHVGANDNVEDGHRGSNSPTKSCNLINAEAGSSKQNDYKEAAASNAAEGRDNNVLLGKEEHIVRPGEKDIDLSGGVRSPGRNLRPRRSRDGSGISSETIHDWTPSKEKKGGNEPTIHSGEISLVPGGSISPRKKMQTKLNFEDPADDRRQPPNVTPESSTGEATRDYKVQCCSKQVLKEVLEMCTGVCKEILESQQYLNEEQKQQHHKNFTWDFETAFQENVSLNGLPWHESPDEDSEPDLKILQDQMDEAMVKTSMKRKRYPRKILSHFVKALKTEREILNQYKPVVNAKRVTLDPAIESRMKDLSATAATVCQHIHETKKALPIQLEKAAGFSQVLNLQPLLAESRIRKDIFYSRVVLEDISKSIPKVLETTLPESEPKDFATPVRNLRKRRISLPQRHLYPIRSKRKISLES